LIFIVANDVIMTSHLSG